MEAERFRAEVAKWLSSTGRMKHVRTVVRTELIQQLMASREAASKERAPDEESLSINTLIMEHLLRSRLWYAASILASEAEFIVDPPRPPAGTGGSSAVPNKLTCAAIDRILGPSSGLRLARHVNSDQLRVAYYGVEERSLLAVVLRMLATTASGGDSAVKRRGPPRGRRSRSTSSRRTTTVTAETTEDDVSRNYNNHSAATNTGRNADDERRDRSEVEDLRRQLEEARAEVEAARREKKAAIAELEKMKKRERQKREDATAAGATGAGTPADVGAFVSDVRSRVDVLYQRSLSIDKELQDL